MTEANLGFGQIDPSSSTNDHNVRDTHIRRVLSELSTMKLVKVVSVDTSNQAVDVQVLVDQVDGQGRSTPHGVVYGVPYLRLFGNQTMGVIIDPGVGDIGILVVSDRDISGVKSKKGQTTPGSSRQFSISDGVYIGGVLNKDPDHYVKFTSDGHVDITVAGGRRLLSDNSGWTMVGNLTLFGNLQMSGVVQSESGTPYSGNISTTGTVTGGADVVGGGKSLKTHVHSGVTVGGGNTGQPV